jgi:hypothetical protein
VKSAGVAAIVAGILGPLACAGAPASADSFTPVGLSVTIAPVARLHQPLKVTVAVSADAGVLDDATSALRIRVRLASECGGSFPYTPGPVLLDRRLAPQPLTGQGYSAQATGSGRPTSYGTQSVCVFLEEQGDDRQFATDTSSQVDVSRPCTVRASRYDAARKLLARAGRARGHRRPPLARLRAHARAAHRAALAACGPGVPL